MKIRIKFRKYGIMKFIGHLDVMRYFQKAIRRADVAICYSGGFSPHQIMSFAAPLGVGITSNGEYVDIEVSEAEGSEVMKERLNSVMSEGFEITSCRRLPEEAANAMSIVAAADYTLAFREGYEPQEGAKVWFEGLVSFFSRPSVMITKKTKKGEKEMDLKPLVYELEYRMAEPDDGSKDRLFMKISTGSAANIKPEQVLDAYYRFLGQERPDFAFLVQREEVYADLTQDHSFQTLEQLGEEF